MTTLVLKCATTFPETVPLLRRDRAINPGMLGLYDFTDSYTYGGAIPAGNLGNNYLFNSQIEGAEDAFTQSGYSTTAVSGGAIPFVGSQILQLPEAFRLPSTAKRFAFGVWATVPKTGWPTGALSFCSLGGCSYATGVQNQYLIQVRVNTSGEAESIAGVLDGNTVEFGLANGAEIAALADILDGLPHQFVVELDGESTPGSVHRRLYVDGVLLKTTTMAWDGVLNVPDSQYFPRLGFISAFTSLATPTRRVFRTWLQGPSVAGGTAIAELVAADFAQNTARFS